MILHFLVHTNFRAMTNCWKYCCSYVLIFMSNRFPHTIISVLYYDSYIYTILVHTVHYVFALSLVVVTFHDMEVSCCC